MKENTILPVRLGWADLTRFIAIVGVLLIHTSAPVFYAKLAIPLNSFLIGNFIDSYSRVAVPLFVMLSGALLLKAEERPLSLSRMFRQISKVFFPLAFWSVIAGFWMDYSAGIALNPWPHLARMFYEPVMYHLGFCYYILGVYMLLPLLETLAVKLIQNRSFAQYFFVTWFIFNCLEFKFSSPLFKLFQLSGWLSWSGYFLLGFYLSRKDIIANIRPQLALLGYLLGGLLTFCLTWYICDHDWLANEMFFRYLSPNVVFCSAALFVYLQKVKIPNFLLKPLASISDVTFMIYFMHLFIIEFIKGGYLRFHVTSFWIHPLIGILWSAILAFVMSFVVAKVVRLIPKSAKITG